MCRECDVAKFNKRMDGKRGTLEWCLVNERLPQKVRLLKYLEGHLPFPATLFGQFSGKYHQD